MNDKITKESIGAIVVFHGGAGSDTIWQVGDITPGEESTEFTLFSEGQAPVVYTFDRHGYGDSVKVVRNLLRRAILDATANRG